jgi:glycosyltransferase involved in cell wall biosynthesis
MKPIKKILMLSHEYPPFGGGGGRVLSRLCEELASRGFEITVLTAAPPVEIRQQFPFRVVYFPTFRKARFKTSVPAMLLYLAQVLQYCMRGKAGGHDFLFSNMSIPAGIAGIIVRKLLRLPHGIWYHNTEVTQNRPDGAGFLFRTAHRFIGKRASVNLFVSKGLMDLARRYGEIPGMGVLPNAVGPFSDSGRQDVSMRHTGTEKVFLFAARMEAVKDPLLLLKAAIMMKSRGQTGDMRFRLVGSGALYGKIAAAISANDLGSIVSLEHAAPFERMADLYRSTYALVLPSVVEGYPTTVLEAATFGVPAIATETIGNSDAISHQETGLLFPPGDAEGLAVAMLLLARDSDLRDRLGGNARERSKKFTIKNTADVFVKAIEDLTQRRRDAE